MNLEEELQRKVEEGHVNDLERSDLNIKVYSVIFKMLQNTPAYAAPPNLTDGVLKKLEQKNQTRYSLLTNDYFWFFVGLAILSASAVFVIFLMNYKIDFGFLKGMSAYKGLVVFALMFIALLNFIDRRLIRNKRSVI